MQFAHPELLWLIPAIVPAMVAFFWWSARKRRALLAGFVHARLLPGLLAGISEGRQRFRQGCLIGAVCLTIVAVARPQWGFTWEEVRQRGLDIVVAIDISKSMLATDIEPNRLVRAKLAALDLMQHARTDRMGLVAFAGSAFLQCPLTIDDSVFQQSVDGLDVQSVSRGGTALSEAIEAAMDAFTEAENYKVLVLLTDGEDHDSGAVEAAARAAEKGLEIFTIGIGTPQGEMVQVKTASGKMDFVRDENGNVVKSRLNEPLLQQIAGATQRGFYLPLRGAKAMDTLYEKGLAPIPKSESREKFVKRYYERYHWPLGAALVLLIVEMLFPERKRLPNSQRAPQGVTVAAKATVVCFLLGFALNAGASASSAARAYESGEYARALREYQELLRSGKEDPRLNFNAGNAAYKSRQFEEAINQFNQALASRDLELQQRAFYNRGNSHFALGDATPDPQHKTDAWQKSLKDFESALKLNPKDGDAAFNRDLVQRKLKELQQQQQQDQKEKPKENQEQQEDQQQNQPQQDQQQQDQQQQQQDQQDQGQEQPKPQDRQNQEQQQQNQQQDQQQQGQKDKEEQSQDPSQPQSEKPQSSEEQQAQPAEPTPEGQMTPEQARRLLNAQKGEEKVLQFRPQEKPQDSSRPFRDW